MFNLRYYQMDAFQAAHTAWERYRSTAIVLPTATGKTELYLSVAVQEPGRVLVLVHRDYLITSPVERLARIGFRDVAIEKAEMRAERSYRRAKIVFASVQSIGPMRQRQRLESFNPKDFSLLIIDEGHRSVSPSYRAVKDYLEAGNPKLKTLILTATPKRRDGLALGNVCESVAYEMTPATAAAEGWIAPPRFFVRDVPELDYSSVVMRGSDMDPDQQADLLTQEEPLHKVCASLAEDQGPTIVFCPKVAVAEVYASVMSKRYRKNRAVAVSEKSTDGEMEHATRGLADGSVDFVFNVDKITEGYDVPKVTRVAWVAPTASLVRWTQGCGRGFRPDASIARQLTGKREDAAARRLLIEQSPKPFCSIVTYYPSNCRHQICSAVDLLGGKDLSPDLKQTAVRVQEETARQQGGSSTTEDIETAQAILDLRAALDERRKHLKAKARVVDAEYDGMGGNSRKLRDRVQADPLTKAIGAVASWGNGDPLSDKQRRWLLWKGAREDVVASCTKWRAVVVRDLFEMGVSLATALGYTRQQALAVRDKLRDKKTQGATA